MRRHHWGLLMGMGLFGGLATLVAAGTVSPVQSTLRPLGLTVIGQVQLLGSDSTAQAFETVRPSFLQTCTTKLPEGVAFTGASLNQLDPQRLYFMFDYAPRVYFLAEGACYTNALGATIATVSSPTNQVLTGNTFTIFPSTKSSIASVCSSGSGKRSQSEPLLSGDFVQLPTVKAGQQLAFFLMANMNSSAVPQATYYNGSSNNPDNFQHMIAFFPTNSQYIIIGFEDQLNGGDKDCNDVLYAIDIGPLNAALLRDPTTLPK